MEFKRGRKKTGGRTASTPNKATVAVREALENLECDLLGNLVQLAHKTQGDTLKARIWLELLQYAYPKQRAVEVQASIETSAIGQLITELSQNG